MLINVITQKMFVRVSCLNERHCIVLYCIVSYRIVSYRIVSYRIVLYCIVLYGVVNELSRFPAPFTVEENVPCL